MARRLSQDEKEFWGYILREGHAGFFNMGIPAGEGSSSEAVSPEPERYSGRISTRIAPHIHAQAAKLAEEQGISLNQYINDAIVAMNNYLLGIQRTVPVVVRAMDDYEKKVGGRSARSAGSGTMTITVPGDARVHATKGKKGDRKWS